MRWDDLFRDLEAQLAEAEAADLAAEVADRTRREAAQLHLVDRLLPVVGGSLRLQVCGVGDVSGELQHVGQEMLLLREPAGRQVLVPTAAILSVRGVSARSAVPGAQGRIFERLRLSSAVRAVARDRAEVRIILRDGASLSGTVDRVGTDFLELAEHPVGEGRRPDAVIGVRVVPLSALGAIVSA